MSNALVGPFERAEVTREGILYYRVRVYRSDDLVGSELSDAFWTKWTASRKAKQMLQLDRGQSTSRVVAYYTRDGR